MTAIITIFALAWGGFALFMYANELTTPEARRTNRYTKFLRLWKTGGIKLLCGFHIRRETRVFGQVAVLVVPERCTACKKILTQGKK